MAKRLYQIGGGPSDAFVKVPNHVVETIDDPVALAILVWAMKKRPEDKVRQEDAVARFHAHRECGEARVRRAWRRLVDLGYFQYVTTPKKEPNFTLRGWEPKKVKAYADSIRERHLCQRPTVGEHHKQTAKSVNDRQSIDAQVKEKTGDQTQDSGVLVVLPRMMQCPLCRGAGHRRANPCTRCSSTGRIAL